MAKHCWNIGEIKDFGEFLRLLQTGVGPQGSISLAPSLDKAFEARDLVMAHKLQNSLKFVCVIPVTDHGQLPEGVVSMVLPVTAGNGFAGPGIRSTRFEKFACVTLGKERPVLPTGLVQEVKNAPPKVEFGTLRFHVPRTFLTNEQWVSWSRNPGSMVLLWLGDTTLIHSSYGLSLLRLTGMATRKSIWLVMLKCKLPNWRLSRLSLAGMVSFVTVLLKIEIVTVGSIGMVLVPMTLLVTWRPL